MKLLIALIMFAGIAQAETVITPYGSYLTTQTGTTTYVTGPSTSSTSSSSSTRAPVAVVAPVAVNPITGIGTLHTPSGSYQVIRQGSTTTYVQTSKSK